ncbi:MAG TPA: DeoR family transcriptional regulator [Rhizobium sp.]|nr:DeoR family transcriptional regulator [Rhizobium sp.]
MRREDRQQLIMDLLVESHAVELDWLAKRFAVSKMTIHRDLDDLEEAGLLRKVRGGATIDASTQFESDFRFRQRQGVDVKKRMAREALQLVEPGMTVIVNDGSMAAVLGAMLVECRPLTVITNNAAVIDVLKDQSGIALIALGGLYSAKFNGYFGVVTEDALQRLRADLAFVSSPALSDTKAFHMDDAVVRTKRAMIASAKRACLLVNHTRFGHTALHVLADLSEFECVITDEKPLPEFADALAKQGVDLRVAKQEM